MKRRDLLRSAGIAAATLSIPRPSLAQTQDVKLVASMIGGSIARGTPYIEALERGLTEEGWVVGENVRCEHRFAGVADVSAAAIAAELLALSPDVFVTGTTVNSLAVRELTETIPIVFAIVTDPVGVGLVDTFARPGGNATGVYHAQPSVGGTYVDMMMEVAPDTTRIIYMYKSDDTAAAIPWRPFAAEAAEKYGLAFEEVEVRRVDDIASVVDTIANTPRAGIVIANSNWFGNNVASLIAATNRHSLPVVSSLAVVEGGGIAGVGVESVESYWRAGVYAGRILNGADPSTLPVLPPVYFTAVNLRAARTLGLEIPSALVARADRVIE